MGTLRTGWPLYAGMLVAGAAAVVASAATLSALARAAGWSGWTPWLLPASIDVGGAAGGWCWLRPGAPENARRFGRVVALSGAAVSLGGNAAGHLLATGYLVPGPVLVVVVGAAPAAVLVALAHLAALLAAGTTPTTTTLDDDARVVVEDPSPDEGGTEAEIQTREAVLALIRTQPLTIAELSRATGRSRTTVIGHLNALEDAGAARRDPPKRYLAPARSPGQENPDDLDP